MIQLTPEQEKELTAMDTPQVLDPGTGRIYVLVQADVFERFRQIMEDELRVTGEMVDRLMEEEDQDDLSLAFYQQEYGHRP